MKSIKISEELFYKIIKFHMLEQYELQDEIRKDLEIKFDKMVERDLYTKYKTVSTKEEQEKARHAYLDKRGVRESFRWEPR